MPKKDIIAKYMFVFLFLATAILSFNILKPFFPALFVSSLLAFIFHSMYKGINKKINNKNISSFISVILVILLIIIPFSMIITGLINETSTIYNSINIKNIHEYIPEEITLFGNNIEISEYNIETLESYSKFLITNTKNVINIISLTMLNLVILFFSLFYFFIYGEKIITITENLLPLKKNKKKIVLKKFYEYVFATLYGTIIIALIQGFLGGLTFFIFGIKAPIFWGFIMFVLSFLPLVGAPLIWLPAAIYQILSGNIFGGVWIIVIGTFVIGTIDNILKPKIVGKAANINPLLVLLGALGGLSYLGIIGLFAGPMILIIFITLLEIYEKGHHL